ncbi:phosphonate ABC transporter, permease protein PhnE [Erysipelothrix sp. HDW6C]|nr:phosphonate ABC transporter, permease protein PhnE [Erysipelothrix sp. HDW6C]
MIKDKWVMAVLAVIVIVSFISVDYSMLSSISWDLARGVFSGLLKPEWSYFYDGSGEDVFSLLILTLGIGFLGTFFASIIAVPVGILSAQNLWKNGGVISRVAKIILSVLRAFPELIYAIIFVKVVGPGPFAGVLAIATHQIGMLGKLFAEEMEAIDFGPVEAMESVGAGFLQTLFFARIPQVLAIFASLIVNHFEIAVRSASTLGLVGAGGIGAPLIFAIQARNWGRVSIILLGVIVTVFVIDTFAAMLRKRLK